jgi:HEAT repeat protein
MRNSASIVLALMVSGTTAYAGKGASTVSLEAAVQSGSADSIVGEIERAEFLPSTGAVAVVLPLIDHSSARVRDAAGWWLTRRGAHDAVVATCKARFAGQDPVGARNCGDALGGMRDYNTLDMLHAYAKAPLDEDSGTAAVRAIGAIGHPSSLAVLNTTLGSSLAGVRAQAAASLRDLRAMPGQKVAAQAGALVPLLADGDANVRRQAALTLGFIGGGGGDVTGVVAALSPVATGDASAVVRKAAAWALGELKDGAARSALVRAQSDSDPFVRSVASTALANLR